MSKECGVEKVVLGFGGLCYSLRLAAQNPTTRLELHGGMASLKFGNGSLGCSLEPVTSFDRKTDTGDTISAGLVSVPALGNTILWLNQFLESSIVLHLESWIVLCNSFSET